MTRCYPGGENGMPCADPVILMARCNLCRAIGIPRAQVARLPFPTNRNTKVTYPDAITTGIEKAVRHGRDVAEL